MASTRRIAAQRCCRESRGVDANRLQPQPFTSRVLRPLSTSRLRRSPPLPQYVQYVPYMPYAPAVLAVAAVLCLIGPGASAQPLPPYRDAPAPKPAPVPAEAEAPPPVVTLTADDVVSRIGGAARASGNVELKRLDVELRADTLEYDQSTDKAHAQGHVHVQRGGDWFTASRLDFELQRSADRKSVV